MIKVGDLLTAAFLLGCSAFAALQTIGWPARTRVFPLAISLPLIIMLVAYFALVAWATLAPQREGVAAIVRGQPEDEAKGWLPDLPRGIVFGAWIAAYTGVLWFAGFMVGAPVMTFLFLRFFGKDSWLASAGLSAGVWAFLYVLLRVLRLPLHQGFINWPF
jgi:hypothetical protein